MSSGKNKSKICPWHYKCQNGGDGCWADQPETCIRYLPTEGTNLTKLSITVETPPSVNCDMVFQMFSNWMNSLGWSAFMSAGPVDINGNPIIIKPASDREETNSAKENKCKSSEA